MIKSGNAHVYGDNINTDLIIAGKYTKTLNMEDLAKHCLEDLDPSFTTKVKKGDFIVAGMNFGCGSSREQAPLALKYSGIAAVLADSFARIFYRNAINIGLPVIVCDTSSIKDGDVIELFLNQNKVIVNGTNTIECETTTPIIRAILEHGGLVSFIKDKGDFIL